MSIQRTGILDLAREVLLMLLRLFPWPTDPGLRSVGSPSPSSPVLVTGNYDLTVRRLLRALEGVDAWAAPTSLVFAALTALFRPAWCLPVIALSWALAVAVFLIYDRSPGPRRLVLGGGAIAVSLLSVALAGGGLPALSAAAIASALLTAILTYDYSGSTPIEGGSHFEERRWSITLDGERCQGIYSCWEVCPEACFEKSLPESGGNRRKVDLAHSEQCICCGACIVQCPEDALCFEDEKGLRVEPDTIRRFKLNLMGRRAVAAAEVETTD